MSEWDEIKQRIKERVNLADWIGGIVKLTGGPVEFKGRCPFHDDSTPSFTVNVEKRFFHCFGCGASGDIFAFVMMRTGLGFVEALKSVANTLGIAVPDNRLYQPPEVKSAAASPRGAFDPEKFRPLTGGSKACEYLVGKRFLEQEVLEAYSVGETMDGEAYAFAYKWFIPGLKLERPRFEFCKVVKVERPEGKKIEWREPKGGKNILFGMHAIKPGTKELVIAEGEIDAMTWAGYGFPAVSVPGGAAYLGWIDICWDWLQQFRKIHISFDEDGAGRKKLTEIVNRLGMATTDIIHLPVANREDGSGERFKDANECLTAGVPFEVMQRCIEQPEVLRPPALKNIYDFEQQIWEKFHPEGLDQVGLLLPWGNHFGSSLPFRFRYGETTVWTGYNKHGKSEVLNHCIIDLCWQGDKALICSLEIQAPESYRKLIRMVMGRRDVCDRAERALFRERCLKPLAEKVWVYDHVGNAAVEDVLNVMLYAFQRYGCRQFVLDSLMKFEGLDGEGQDQWNRQRDFMNAIITFAARYHVHVHLVAHSKKPDKAGEAKIPRRYDISGSAYISNLPHNVIVIWRNRHKQDELEKVFQVMEEQWSKTYGNSAKQPSWKRLIGGAPGDNAPSGIQESWKTMKDFLKQMPEELQKNFYGQVSKHDGYFIVDAQRGGDGDCPARHLWFHYDSLQFTEASPYADLGPNDPRKFPKDYYNKAVTEMDEAL